MAADLEAAGKAGQAATLMKARYVLERGDWQVAVEIPLAHDGGFDDVTARFARALGASRLEKIEQAKAELSGLRALRAGIEQASGAYWAGFVDIHGSAVDGWIAKAEGHTEKGLERMQAAADLDDAREKSIAMENKLLPMRELLGEFLLEIGRPAPAEAEFAKSLKKAPNRYRSLLGGARAAVAVGDMPKARDDSWQVTETNAQSRCKIPGDSQARNYLER